MTELSRMLQTNTKSITKKSAVIEKSAETIDIDYLLADVLIIKAESVKDEKIFKYADYLEKQLLKIKRKQAVLEL